MEQNLHQTQTVTVIALIIFALIMIAIGIFSARKTKTMDGFLLGGRKIGAWAMLRDVFIKRLPHL